MNKKIEPRLLKGFRDYGPLEQQKRQALFGKIQTVFEQFSFLPLSTPVLEYRDVLMGEYGDDEKLVYNFKDHGKRDVAMRYDLTVPMARFVAQNQGSLAYPFKRYVIAPVWRADSPQKGRLREFYQCDVDVVGSEQSLSDAEVIACLGKAIEAVGVTKYTVRINDREVLAEFSEESVRSIDKFEKIGVKGVQKDLENKNVDAVEIEKVIAFLEDPQSVKIPERLQRVMTNAEKLGLPKENIVFDPTIARGLSYYTGTVFETVLTDNPSFGSICSGGRYDKLVDKFSKKPLPAVGGSIGIDRLYDALEELGIADESFPLDVIILNVDVELQENYMTAARALREAGVRVELYYDFKKKLEKQFKYAEKKRIPFAILIGQDEAVKNIVQLKNLETREQEEMTLEVAIKKLLEK